jgi:hypothetical protein
LEAVRMGLAVAIVVGIAALVVVWFVVSGYAVRKSAKDTVVEDMPEDPKVETLRYRVPDTQDPAVLITHLEQVGYTSTLDEVRGDKVLSIACPAGRDDDRPRIRSALHEVDTTGLEGAKLNPGRVTFEDEK